VVDAAELRVCFENYRGEVLILPFVGFLKLHVDGVDTHLDVSDALYINNIATAKKSKNEIDYSTLIPE